MQYFIYFAKFLMLVIWGLLLINLFKPFPGNAAILFYFVLAFICIMHLIVLVVVKRAFSKKTKLTKREALSVFIFGGFSIWTMRGRLA